jgi:hypothetical protein
MLLVAGAMFNSAQSASGLPTKKHQIDPIWIF